MADLVHFIQTGSSNRLRGPTPDATVRHGSRAAWPAGSPGSVA